MAAETTESTPDMEVEGRPGPSADGEDLLNRSESNNEEDDSEDAARREARRLRRQQRREELLAAASRLLDDSDSDGYETRQSSSRFSMPSFVGPVPVVVKKLPLTEPNLDGGSVQLNRYLSNPSGENELTSNLNGEGSFKGHPDAVKNNYETVASLRLGNRLNPNLSKGGAA